MKNRSKNRSQKVVIKPEVHPDESTENISKENDVSEIKSNDSDSSANRVFRSRVIFPSSEQSDSKSVTTNTSSKIPGQFSTNEFVPVTLESIQHVQSEIKRLFSDSRLVLIVFNECFTKPDLTFNMIKGLLEPVVGQLDSNCVLLKSNLSKLMPNIAETYVSDFKILNQAYVICPKATCEEEVARKASERNILYGVMTFGCVFNSLQNGTCFVKKETIITNGAPAPNLKRTIKQQTFDKAQDIIILEGSIQKSASSNKSSKTTANVDRNHTRASKQKGPNKDIRDSNQTKIRDFVSEIFPKLTTLGDSVLRIDHLPSQTSMDSLNILLGCHTLERDQVIATKRREKDLDVIDIHIICRSDSNEKRNILKLHNQDIADKIKLQVKITTFKELESYLFKNYDRILKLEIGRTLPLKVIGYSNKNC